MTDTQALLDSLTKDQRDHVCGMAVCDPDRAYTILAAHGLLWVEQDGLRRRVYPSEVRRKLKELAQ